MPRLQGRQDGGVGRGRVEDWHALVALGAELRGHAGAEARRVRPVNGTELQDAVVLVGGWWAARSHRDRTFPNWRDTQSPCVTPETATRSCTLV